MLFRSNGRTFQREEDGFAYDNRWVAPYNAWLSLKFNCHINIDICTNIDAVKYIYKYVYKGSDRAMVSVSEGNMNQAHDELREYQDGRYVGASEAAWRLLRFPMHKEYPTVVRLAIHLPDQQQVVFDPSRHTADDKIGRAHV